MCMLTYFPPGALPVTSALDNGAATNRDGHGFAIVTDRGLIIRHGMDSDRVIDKFAELRTAFPDGPALFHSRFGTGGSVSRYNCHPFRVGGDPDTVIGHNGVLPSLAQPPDKDRRSDTRYCAEELLYGANLGDAKIRDTLAKWMGPRNKFVILTTNPDYDSSAWILNESSGIWHDGIWYSNDDFMDLDTYVPWWKRQGSWWRDSAPISGRLEPCPICQAVAVDAEYGYCASCGACLDCAQDWGECQCYRPARGWAAGDEWSADDESVTVIGPPE